MVNRTFGESIRPKSDSISLRQHRQSVSFLAAFSLLLGRCSGALSPSTEPVFAATDQVSAITSPQDVADAAQVIYLKSLTGARERMLSSPESKACTNALRVAEQELVDAKASGEPTRLTAAASERLDAKANLNALLSSIEIDPTVTAARLRRDELKERPSALTPSIDLLHLIQIPNDAVAGLWIQQKQGLKCRDTQGWPRVDFPVSLSGSYELEISFTRKLGKDYALGVIFPAGATDLALVLGGWGDSTSGLEAIGGNGASVNQTTFHGDISRGVEHSCSIRVEPAGSEVAVRVEVDDLPVIVWEGSQQDGTLLPQWKLSIPHTIGLSIGSGTDTCIQSCRCFPLNGAINFIRSSSTLASVESTAGQPVTRSVPEDIGQTALNMAGGYASGEPAFDRKLQEQGRAEQALKMQRSNSTRMQDLEQHASIEARTQLSLQEQMLRDANSPSSNGRSLEDDERQLMDLGRDSLKTQDEIRRLNIMNLQEAEQPAR